MFMSRKRLTALAQEWRPASVFIVGQKGNAPHVWHVQGVFYEEKVAIEACKTWAYFYFEAEIGKTYPSIAVTNEEAGVKLIFPHKQ